MYATSWDYAKANPMISRDTARKLCKQHGLSLSAYEDEELKRHGVEQFKTHALLLWLGY